MSIRANTTIECPKCQANLYFYCYSDWSVGISGSAEILDQDCDCEFTESEWDSLEQKAWKVYNSGE